MQTDTRNASRKFSGKLHHPFLLLAAFLLFCSHDLYLKMDTYFFQPNEEATLSLYNGTFESSENIITRDRMLDASTVGQGKRVAIRPEQWQDQDSTITRFTFTTGEPGTYVAGVSTKARNIELAADKFNSYLEHDGVLDMLEYRTANGLLEQDAVESYQKHVKAIYQVGDQKTDDWSTALGYPIEFIPRDNPYEKYSGGNLAVQLLLDGNPLPDQLVYADYLPDSHGHTHGDHAHDHGEDGHSHEDGATHTHTSGQRLRTDAQGIVTVSLPEDGVYYLRTIHMENVTDSEELTHQSKWATLTFEVTHEHGAATHTHEDHEHEEGIPTWVYLLGSVAIIGVLFLYFSNKEE